MYIYGKNVAEEALLKGEKIKQAFIYEKFNDKNLLNKISSKNIKINYVTKYDLDRLQSGNHQGIILEVPDYDYASLDEVLEEEIIVMLDHLEDPHNLGAIIRTCEAAGIKSLIIPKDRSVRVNATVIKVSVGAIENVKIAMVNNLVNTLKELKDKGYWVIGTDMEGTDFKKIDYSGKIIIVIGSEGKGLSRLTEENCDFIASIPMRGEVNSLNASVAAALVIYEAVRNRGV
ncbi:MAG: 23S rRNA (guanosine(2251)-2'-O)-methyltransferase RlmB [Bacilli bacterium]